MRGPSRATRSTGLLGRRARDAGSGDETTTAALLLLAVLLLLDVRMDGGRGLAPECRELERCTERYNRSYRRATVWLE